MKLKARCILALIGTAAFLVLAATQPTLGQDREFWGAIVTSFTHDPHRGRNPNQRHVYGLAWNYPTAEGATARAAKECANRNGIHCYSKKRSIMLFSTSARRHRDDYMQVRSVAKKRCLAIGLNTFYDTWDAGAGNSDSEARANLAKMGRDMSNVSITCNAR